MIGNETGVETLVSPGKRDSPSEWKLSIAPMMDWTDKG
jgi:hypothetical protein